MFEFVAILLIVGAIVLLLAPRIMRRRGFSNKSEAVRTVIEEVAGTEETPEEVQTARRAALERLSGIIKEPFDYQKERDWIYEGMDDL